MHILFHRPTPWSSSIQCSTKTLASLAAEKGHRVTYLQNSINLAHWLTGKGYYSTWKEGPRHESERIYITSGLSLVPDLTGLGIYGNTLAAASYRTCLPGIRKQVARSGFGEPDLIWTTVPGSSVLGRIFPNATLVFHVIDLYSAFRGPAIRRLEVRDYQMADHVFCIGNTLRNYLGEELQVDKSKMTVLGQGVHLDRYLEPAAEPEELRGIPRPRAVWVGVLDKLDAGLLKTTAQRMAERGGSVVLIGPVGRKSREFLDSDDLGSKTNLHCLGPRNTDLVPACLQHCDVGIMLYDREKQEVYRGQNPLKLYEYLASGLPVISTPHDEFEFLNPPVEIVTREDEISQAIAGCLGEDAQRVEARRQFVAARSWPRVFDRAMEVVETLRK